MGSDLIGSMNSEGRYSLFGYLLVRFNKLFLKKYDFIITKSQNLAQIIRSKSRNVTIPNGIDFNKFKDLGKDRARTILNIKPEKKIIIFVSDPDRKEKNYRLVKNALDLLNDKNIELITVHSIDQEKLNLYYSAADLLIMTSYHEGSPNVIKEAMACNCPIVSTDVGDVRWVIGNTEGCYITSFDLKDVVDKIKLALKYGQRTNGREQIKHLDNKLIAKKIIEVYKAVIGKVE
jgi:glycosyltransferase involved in cell wall biosynthesis